MFFSFSHLFFYSGSIVNLQGCVALFVIAIICRSDASDNVNDFGFSEKSQLTVHEEKKDAR